MYIYDNIPLRFSYNDTFQSEVEEKIKIHILRSIALLSYRLWDNMKNILYILTGRRAHALYMLGNYGYRHTLRICNAYFFSTATAVKRTHLNFKVIRTKPVLFNITVIWDMKSRSLICMYWRFRGSRYPYHRLQDDTASHPRSRQWCRNFRRLNGLLLLYRLHTEQTALPTLVLAWITNREHFGSCSKHWNVTFIFSAAMPANITIYFKKSIPTRKKKKKRRAVVVVRDVNLRMPKYGTPTAS